MAKDVEQYEKEMKEELDHILTFWMEHTVDDEQGGFYGKIENNNTVLRKAPKGAVLNSRILWAFAAAYRHTGNEQHLAIAHRAYNYINEFFIDKEYGGVYWTVDYSGKPLDTKKQIYALAFAVYGLSEYYRASGIESVKDAAMGLYRTIVEKSYDATHGGYIEALTRDWQEITDLRLSTKDANEKKSMNTHLHLLEGFANLYRIWPDETLRKQVTELIYIFLDHIIDKETHHLVLFFDEAWTPKSSIISYGHDIEAAWLVQEAAEIIGDAALVQTVKDRSVKIAEAARRGLDIDGGLWYEFDAEDKHLVSEKHWWPQGEAMVGFFNAYQNTGDEAFLQLSLNSWRFTQRHILDQQNGEWFWGVKEDYTVMQEDKVGLWKCPYHNSRACLEIINRVQTI